MASGVKTSKHDRTSSVTLKIEANPPQSRKPSLIQILARNLSYFTSQIGVIFTNSSLVVQLVSVTLIVFYLLTLIDDNAIRNIFTLTPSSAISPGSWVWSAIGLVCHPFVEFHWWQVVVDILSMSFCATLIEPLWGQKEVVTFFVLINLTVGFVTVITYIVIYTITTDASLLFTTYINGLSAFCAAICVTIKQLLPQSVLIVTSLGKIKNDHVPLGSLAVAVILYLLNVVRGPIVVLFAYGILFSWFYLRFIQFHASPGGTSHRGDLSDGFAFYTLFPNVLQPIVAPIANGIHSLFVQCGLPLKNQERYQGYRLLSERLTQQHQGSNGYVPNEPRVQDL